MTSSSASDTGAASAAPALALAGRGWHVFPCAGKIPRTRNGCKDATADPAVITGWWDMWPGADIGVATGGGLVVLDVDGEPGADALHQLERAHDPLPATVCAITGGGGAHYYFASTAPVRNSAGKLGAGLDVRGDGGYVVAPPSSHLSGRRYEWDQAPDEAEVAQLPEWLLGLLRPAAGDHQSVHARAVSEWRALAVGGATEGARNDSAARLAGHLLARKVDPHVVHALVVAWDAQRNRPPLGEAEITSTVESIARAELRRRR
jgi:hypothetical protein